MTTHFRTMPGPRSAVACGRGGDYPTRTLETGNVTCARCVRTAVFRAAALDQAQASGIILDNVVVQDPEREAMQKGIDLVLDRAHAIAKDRGYCDTYDRIVEDIALPHGLTVKPRRARWVATICIDVPMDEDYEGGVRDALVDSLSPEFEVIEATFTRQG